MKRPSSNPSTRNSTIPFVTDTSYDVSDNIEDIFGRQPISSGKYRKDANGMGSVSGDSKEDKKKRKTKAKKQNEKELLTLYQEVNKKNTEPMGIVGSSNIGNDSYDTSIIQQRKYYENIHYFSQKEKESFEQKFTQPKNDSQDQYAKLLQYKSNKIVIATGPAGTGKTLFATEYGIRNFLTGKYKKLVFTRPSVSVDEELGFLPGTLEDKMAPWIRPIYDILYQFIHPKEVAELIEEKVIEIAPLGFMRGRTFLNCWIVADEMQNSSTSQMKMLMTRLGENSRIVITGDLDQHDRAGEINGLEDFLDKFRGKRSPSISSFEFHNSDIQREEVVREVLEIYSGVAPPAEFLEENYQEEEEKNIII
jgi:phosphate starvation-inducible PhoH-like protein